MKVVCCAAALLLLAGAACADGFKPLPILGSTRLDLDVQDGHFCGWIINDLGAVNAVRATLQVHRRGSDAKWAPTFSIALVNGKNRVTFNLLAAAPDLPMVARVSQPADKADDLGQLLGKLDMDTPLDVAIDWTPDGSVTVKAGGKSAAVSLGAPVKGLEITGSTGEFELNPLQIGTATP